MDLRITTRKELNSCVKSDTKAFHVTITGIARKCESGQRRGGIIMAKEIKTIGVLTSGGDAPGMNAAVRAVVTDEILKEYADPESARYEAMQEEIRRQLNFTSLRFNRLDDLIEATGLDKSKLCTYCWDGEE